MRRSAGLLSAVVPSLALILVPQAKAYEWKTHNKVSWSARDITLNRTPAPFSDTFKKFLIELGDKHIDNRAGNECDVNDRNASCLPTDEDHTEGFEMPWGMCDFRETKCFAVAEPLAPVTPGFLNIMACTKDHFHPKLPLPLNADDAIWHAHWYFDIAVRNYKASLCSGRIDLPTRCHPEAAERP